MLPAEAPPAAQAASPAALTGASGAPTPVDRTRWLPPSPTRPRLQQFPEPCQREGGAQPDSSFSQNQVAAGGNSWKMISLPRIPQDLGRTPRTHAHLCTCARALSLCHLRPHLSTLSTACVSLVSDHTQAWPGPRGLPGVQPHSRTTSHRTPLASILAGEKAPAPSKKVPDVSLTEVLQSRNARGVAGFPGWGPAPVTWERRPPAQPLPPGSPSGGHQSQTRPPWNRQGASAQAGTRG